MTALVLLAFLFTLASSLPRRDPQNPRLIVSRSKSSSLLPRTPILQLTAATTPLLILCRNGSCRSGIRRFICRYEDDTNVIPPTGLTLLLSAEQIGHNKINVQYQATVPFSLVERGFLGSIPWRATMNNRRGGITCGSHIPILGDPVVSSEAGWCCSACSWLSPHESQPPSLLCCDFC